VKGKVKSEKNRMDFHADDGFFKCRLTRLGENAKNSCTKLELLSLDKTLRPRGYDVKTDKVVKTRYWREVVVASSGKTLAHYELDTNIADIPIMGTHIDNLNNGAVVEVKITDNENKVSQYSFPVRFLTA
jgi:hypothetical protein